MTINDRINTQTVKTFVWVFVVNAVAATIVMVGALGYNQFTHKVNWGTGWSATTNVLGDLVSLSTLVGALALAMFIGAAFGFLNMAETDYRSNPARKHKHVALAMGALVASMALGIMLATMGDKSGLVSAALLVVIAAQTAAASWLHRTR